MQKKWTSERQWTPNNAEKVFEKLLESNGYIIKGYREYQTKTEYLIEKENIELTTEIPHINNKGSLGKSTFEMLEKYYQLKKEIGMN